MSMTQRDYARQAAKDRAVASLAFYLRELYEAASKPWTQDNEAEVRDIVDAIVDASR